MAHRQIAWTLGLMAAVITTQAAHARTWYILDSPRDRCWLAATAAATFNVPALSSPQAMIDLQRHGGMVPSIKVTRDDDENIIEVDVQANGVINSWFSSEALCLKAKAIAERSGEIAPPNELK